MSADDNVIQFKTPSDAIPTIDTEVITVFLCRYAKRRDSIIGTVLFVCWVYQIYQTAVGERIAASSDVLFSGVLFTVIFSAGGNIMSVVVISKLIARIKSIWLLIKRPFTFMVKK
ncbi:hypothetical protein [Providencia rettgeri]|uniref:hypothetical protein n=1 Tax=Providencia rettgeri TaxID=587 RepID=UPI003D2DC939